jgi:hypothetical protein
MTAIIGNTALKDITISTGVDPTVLANYKTTSSMSYESIIAQLATGLQTIANEITSSPLYGGLVYVTNEMQVQYRMGGNAVMEVFEENTKAKFQRGTMDGHGLPLLPYDIGMGWTWRSLERIKPAKVQSDIQVVLDGVRDRYRVSLLTRLLKRGDDSGAVLGLGATGLAPGFATTAASTGVDFTPPTYQGKTFLGTHEHYASTADSGSIVIASVTAMRNHLKEHGHQEPFDMLISEDDRTVWEALLGFYPAVDGNINYAAATATAKVTFQEGYIGFVQGFRVRVAPGMPNNYAFGYKSYGTNNPRNPLVIRVPEDKTGLDLRLLTDGATPAEPLRGAYLFTEFGVGVGQDRTNGVPSYSNSATWADGTAT